MEKISGILPQTARVASVDMKEAAPIRPGTPSFGRPESTSRIRGTKIGETSQRASQILTDIADWKAKENLNAQTAKDITEGFSSVVHSAPESEFVPPGSYLDVVA